MIPETFWPVNVTDTCAIWNLVSSPTLFRTARKHGLSFVITSTVSYECFVKSRDKPPSRVHAWWRERLRQHLQREEVGRMESTIDDLQEVMGIARREGLGVRLGHGEISCIAVARRLRHAVLTDNKRDFGAIRRLVDGLMQTTPRLLGWLYVEEELTDGSVREIIGEHRRNGGEMGKVYEVAHREACQKVLMGGDRGGAYPDAS